MARMPLASASDGIVLSMPCRHDPDAVRIKRFSQQEFFLSVHGIDLKERERLCREDAAKRASLKADAVSVKLPGTTKAWPVQYPVPFRCYT